jgi:NAD(P)-dependent dehydrogenase (short-subunit alcohol dehydrogenase family)
LTELGDKVALITGAAGNLGQAVAEALHEAGARLALADVAEDRLKERYGPWYQNGEHMIVRTDLTEEESVQQMVEQAISHFGRIDVLANIAGGFVMGPLLHETSPGTWDFMLNLNTRSVFLTCRATIPHMLEGGGGKIVNVSARAALQGKAKMGPYCASKAAVITLTEALAAEHRYDKINVNCILPGTIDTPENRHDMPDADFSTWVPPAALADVVLFLCSDAARAVTGAAVPVYGRS